MDKNTIARTMFDDRTTLSDYEQEILLKMLIINCFHWENQYDNAKNKNDKKRYWYLMQENEFFINYICNKNNEKALKTREMINKYVEKEFNDTFNFDTKVEKA